MMKNLLGLLRKGNTHNFNYGYDESGNINYCRDRKGVEVWLEFDERNNITHYKNSKGYIWWKEYNSDNRVTRGGDSRDCFYWKAYDSSGRLISHTTLVRGEFRNFNQ